MGFLSNIGLGGGGGVTGTLMGWATSTGFWALFFVGMIFFLFFILWIRKRRKLNKIVLEHFDLGDGRFDWRTTKGGWFKEKVMLFGLWDYGQENIFRLKDNTPVENVSHNDYRLFNGKQAIGVIRNPHDSKIVFPISKYGISPDSKEMMVKVAPADYRSAAVKSIEQADLEMTAKWQQYAPLIITGVVIVIGLVITLLNTQYGKYAFDKAANLIVELKSTPCSAIPSVTP